MPPWKDAQIYHCVENDNVIRLHEAEDTADLDELHIASCLQKDWLVFGIKDLQAALTLVGYSIVKN
jgi:hypothetical protein